MRQRILVVGAGISGLAVAVGLHRRGVEVTVVEDRRESGAGTGITLWPNALAALDALGVGDDVRAAGGRVTAGALRWHDGTWLRKPSTRRIVTALGEPLVVVSRARLIDLLAGALPAGTIEYGAAAVELVAADSQVTVTLADGTIRTTDAVVGADGVGSVVAVHLNGALRHRYAGYTAWRGVSGYAIDAEFAGETVGAGTQFGHVPLGPRHTYWFATERRSAGCASPGGELPYLQDKFRGWADPVSAVLESTLPANVLRNDVFDRAAIRRWARGRVVLVGDAAHPMRPHLGQGGCQALEDAAVLAHCVAVEGDLAAAFSRYVAARRSRARALTRESRFIGQLINARPTAVGAAAMRASRLVPESVLTGHLATVASRAAFVLPAATP